jgi:sulfur carrier protein
MTVTVNGEACRLDGGTTLLALVETLGCGTKGVAVAVNEAVVPRSAWPGHRLHDDDRVELLTAAQGG